MARLIALDMGGPAASEPITLLLQAWQVERECDSFVMVNKMICSVTDKDRIWANPDIQRTGCQRNAITYSAVGLDPAIDSVLLAIAEDFDDELLTAPSKLSPTLFDVPWGRYFVRSRHGV